MEERAEEEEAGREGVKTSPVFEQLLEMGALAASSDTTDAVAQGQHHAQGQRL